LEHPSGRAAPGSPIQAEPVRVAESRRDISNVTIRFGIGVGHITGGSAYIFPQAYAETRSTARPGFARDSVFVCVIP
jgi:hypothetical protein